MPGLFNALPTTDASAATGFAGNAIDRRSEERATDAVAVALADPAARVYLFRGDRVLLAGEDAPLFTRAEAEAFGAAPEATVLLGWTEDGPRLAVSVPETAEEDAAVLMTGDLRGLAIGGTMSAAHLGALAQARSLTTWHQRHRFCGVCGSETAMTAGGYRRDCPACGAQHFPRTDPVVIMLSVHEASDMVLLARQKHFAPGMYSCLAGFLEPGETIEAAVRRETREEAGVAVGRVRYHASQPWPFPSSLMIGCIAEALSTDITRDERELEACRWFPRREVLAMLDGTHGEGLKAPMPMAIAHHLIRAWAENRL